MRIEAKTQKLRKDLSHWTAQAHYWESLAEEILRSGADEEHIARLASRCQRRYRSSRQRVQEIAGRLEELGA